MSRKTERHRRKHAGQRRKKARRIAAAVAWNENGGTLAVAKHSEAGILLLGLAESLNALEDRGIEVTLASGAVITDHGYIFRLGTEHGVAVWEPRTRAVAPFPVPPALPGEED
jgi:hypothetical protein